MITLALTDHEAFTLRMVLDRIDGSITRSRRKYTQSVLDKLIAQEVPYDDDLTHILHGDLHFFQEKERFPYNG